MKFWNLAASTAEDGAKVLDVAIFGDIEGWLDGVSSKDIAEQLAAHPDAKRITSRINSFGGDLFAGLAIYNLLQNHPAEVTSIVEGMAGSAASIVAMAGRTVMSRGAMLFVHNPIAGVHGNAEDMRQMADILDKAQSSLLAVYKKKTGRTTAQLKTMLNAETWMTAEEAKSNGFADAIASDKPVKAKADGEMVILNSMSVPRTKVPQQILNLIPLESPVETPEPVAAQPVIIAQPVAAESPLGVVVRPTPVTRESIPAEIVASLLTEGHAAGVTAERARLRSIDELGATGDLVMAAKYGETPGTAESLAVTLWKSQQAAGVNVLAARRIESAAAAGVSAAAPDATRHASEASAAKQIAAYANGRGRGGVR